MTQAAVAIAAAVRAGQRYGLRPVNPVVIQETNNALVWLCPHQVIAKVGTRRDQASALAREYLVARRLVELGARVAAPVVGTTPIFDLITGCTVTLWQRLEGDQPVTPDPHTIGAALRELHNFLAQCNIDLPDFREDLWRARRVLDDEDQLAALAPVDRDFLRHVFDTLMRELEAGQFSCRPLHGEPHDRNRLVTAGGIYWIDFESTCLGPLEWDLAFLADESHDDFGEIDAGLLRLTSLLNSARVATWCWMRAHLPEMRWHGEHHLRILRDSWTPPSQKSS